MSEENATTAAGLPEGYGTQEPLETLVMGPTGPDAAASPEDGPEAQGPAPEPQEDHNRRRAALMAGGVAALALVAGLGIWAPWGGDSPTGQTDPAVVATEAGAAGQADVTQASAPATLAYDLTTMDVERALRGLTLLGTDVSVTDGSARSFVHDGDVLVTQVTSDSDADCLGMAARRAAALSAELGDRCASVTWVEAGEDGVVRVAVRVPAAASPASPSWEDALGCAEGWAASEAVAKAADVAQAHGEVPTSLAGKEIVPGVAVVDPASGRLDPTPLPKSDDGEGGDEGEEKGAGGPDATTTATVTPSAADRASRETADAADAQQPGARPAAEGSGSTTRTKDTSSQQPSQQQSPGQPQEQRQRTWVPEQGHYEDVYESQEVKTGQRWVEDSAAWDEQVPDGERIVCSDGTVWHDMGSCDAHMEEVALAGGSVSYRVETEYRTVHHDATGHYEDIYESQQVKTGRRWVVDVPGHWE